MAVILLMLRLRSPISASSRSHTHTHTITSMTAGHGPSAGVGHPTQSFTKLSSTSFLGRHQAPVSRLVLMLLLLLLVPFVDLPICIFLFSMSPLVVWVPVKPYTRYTTSTTWYYIEWHHTVEGDHTDNNTKHLTMLIMVFIYKLQAMLIKGQTPENGTLPRFRATKLHTKLHVSI